MKCSFAQLCRWKLGGFTSYKGCQKEDFKTNKKIKSHGWNRVKFSRTSSKKQTQGDVNIYIYNIINIYLYFGRRHQNLTTTLKGFVLPLGCFFQKFPSFSFKGSGSLTSHHHPKPSSFSNFTLSFGSPPSYPCCVQVAFWKHFGYSCYVFNQAKLCGGQRWNLEWPLDWDGRIGRMDWFSKAQQTMAPWYFFMVKVASPT